MAAKAPGIALRLTSRFELLGVLDGTPVLQFG